MFIIEDTVNMIYSILFTWARVESGWRSSWKANATPLHPLAQCIKQYVILRNKQY